MARGRSSKIISMIKWIWTNRLSITNSLDTLDTRDGEGDARPESGLDCLMCALTVLYVLDCLISLPLALPPPNPYHPSYQPSELLPSVVTSASERRGKLKRFEGPLPESQGQNLALSVLHVPYPLDIGPWTLNPEYHTPTKIKTLQGYLAHRKTPNPLGPP